MQHATSYQHCNDHAGEREDAKQERRDAIRAELTGDYETLASLIVETLARRPKGELVYALAYQMAANWASMNSADWESELRNSLENDDSGCVDDILDAEIKARLIIEGDKP